ncbi:hypothetical protein quinque_003145 [Culex quinquefasciatus]
MLAGLEKLDIMPDETKPQYESDDDKESEQDFDPHFDRSKLHAQFQQFNGIRSRMSSFDTISEWLGPKVTLMAEAGFFHTGFRDMVQCFYCGLRMGAWHQHENAWFLHTVYLHDRSCDYLNHMMGKRYLSYVKKWKRRPSLVERRWCFDAERNGVDDWVPCADKVGCALCQWEESG